MRTHVYYCGRRYNTDGIDHYSHVVMVGLNKEPLIPASRRMSAHDIAKLTPEARNAALDELRGFGNDETRGKFAIKPARWAPSEEAANTIAAVLRGEMLDGGKPKYSTVIVMPVSGVIEHG